MRLSTINVSEKIEMRKVSDLSPFDRNPKTHPAKQIAKIAASIAEFGFTNPVLVDSTGTIVAGHGRVLAAQKLKLDMVPVITLGHLNKQQILAYLIADNKTAESPWDEDLLAGIMCDLKMDDFDLSMTGFDSDDILKMLSGSEDGSGTSGETDPDEVPESDGGGVIVAKLGDVWILGDHRIVCGDSTDTLVVDKCLNGATPHLMVTDPPYGVEYDPSFRAEAGINKSVKKLGKVLNDDKFDWRDAWALFQGDVAYVWHASMFSPEVLDSLEVCGFSRRSYIVWGKDRFAIGRSHYHWQHEPCWYVVRDGKTGHWNGDRSQTTLWKINSREDGGHGHSTQKPVECMKRPIMNNSNISDCIYEPFSGSGTTIIACEQTMRKCCAIELNPAYVDIAIKRWQNFTNRSAILESTGKTFSEMSVAA